ncbi:MAG: protein-glutamate O-methyltransferase [Rubrimonas sp.]|uniref:CheR family methyltransferase n=1 Tax=Rubrimonas sp. TaxID=2036015 RepID=UPI002FDDD56D
MIQAAAAATRSTAEFVRTAAPREFAFTDREFDKIAKRLYEEAGIDMPRSKEPLVYSRLAKRIRQLGLGGFKDYIELIERAGTDEIEHMLVALTTNVTRYFREPHHFDDLRAAIMPGLIEKARARRKVRLWSAGCSSGEEPYSIALTVLETMPDARSFDVKILATDINTHVLRMGRAGLYPAQALEPAPKVLIEKYFSRAEDGVMQAGEELRSMVFFRPLNLMGDWPMRGQFDVIFCRNVAIYFDESTQATIWRRLAEKLVPGGRLYIGHSERIGGPAAQMLVTDGVTSYRRAGGAV